MNEHIFDLSCQEWWNSTRFSSRNHVTVHLAVQHCWWQMTSSTRLVHQKCQIIIVLWLGMEQHTRQGAGSPIIEMQKHSCSSILILLPPAIRLNLWVLSVGVGGIGWELSTKVASFFRFLRLWMLDSKERKDLTKGSRNLLRFVVNYRANSLVFQDFPVRSFGGKFVKMRASWKILVALLSFVNSGTHLWFTAQFINRGLLIFPKSAHCIVAIYAAYSKLYLHSFVLQKLLRAKENVLNLWYRSYYASDRSSYLVVQYAKSTKKSILHNAIVIVYFRSHKPNK